MHIIRDAAPPAPADVSDELFAAIAEHISKAPVFWQRADGSLSEPYHFHPAACWADAHNRQAGLNYIGEPARVWDAAYCCTALRA